MSQYEDEPFNDSEDPSFDGDPFDQDPDSGFGDDWSGGSGAEEFVAPDPAGAVDEEMEDPLAQGYDDLMEPEEGIEEEPIEVDGEALMEEGGEGWDGTDEEMSAIFQGEEEGEGQPPYGEEYPDEDEAGNAMTQGQKIARWAMVGVGGALVILVLLVVMSMMSGGESQDRMPPQQPPAASGVGSGGGTESMQDQLERQTRERASSAASGQPQSSGDSSDPEAAEEGDATQQASSASTSALEDSEPEAPTASSGGDDADREPTGDEKGGASQADPFAEESRTEKIDATEAQASRSAPSESMSRGGEEEAAAKAGQSPREGRGNGSEDDNPSSASNSGASGAKESDSSSVPPEEIERLKQTIVDLTSSLGDLEGRVKGRNQRIEALENTIANLTEELTRMEARAKQLEEKQATVAGSSGRASGGEGGVVRYEIIGATPGKAWVRSNDPDKGLVTLQEGDNLIGYGAIRTIEADGTIHTEQGIVQRKEG